MNDCFLSLKLFCVEGNKSFIIYVFELVTIKELRYCIISVVNYLDKEQQLLNKFCVVENVFCYFAFICTLFSLVEVWEWISKFSHTL